MEKLWRLASQQQLTVRIFVSRRALPQHCCGSEHYQCHGLQVSTHSHGSWTHMIPADDLCRWPFVWMSPARHPPDTEGPRLQVHQQCLHKRHQVRAVLDSCRWCWLMLFAGHVCWSNSSSTGGRRTFSRHAQNAMPSLFCRCHVPAVYVTEGERATINNNTFQVATLVHPLAACVRHAYHSTHYGCTRVQGRGCNIHNPSISLSHRVTKATWQEPS